MESQIAFFNHQHSVVLSVCEKEVKKSGRYPVVTVLVFDESGNLSQQSVPVTYFEGTLGKIEIEVATGNKNGYIILS